MTDTIALICGRTKRISIGIQDANGEPYELAPGDVITMTVKQRLRDPSEAIVKTGAKITFEPRDTACLEPGSYVYDITLSMQNGDVFTLVPHPSSGKSCADFILMKGVAE